jgi:hypothetical protein
MQTDSRVALWQAKDAMIERRNNPGRNFLDKVRPRVSAENRALTGSSGPGIVQRINKRPTDLAFWLLHTLVLSCPFEKKLKFCSDSGFQVRIIISTKVGSKGFDKTTVGLIQ